MLHTLLSGERVILVHTVRFILCEVKRPTKHSEPIESNCTVIQSHHYLITLKVLKTNIILKNIDGENYESQIIIIIIISLGILILFLLHIYMEPYH